MKFVTEIVALSVILVSGLNCAKNPNGADIDIEQQDKIFIEHTIDLNFAGIHCIKVIDMDGDGDFDIVAGASALGSIFWWENKVL